MKDTNEIEKAIRDKCVKEINNIVDSFLNEIENKLRGEYNSCSFYELKHASVSDKKGFSVMGTNQLKTVLNNMLIIGHIDSMLSIKSRELIKKLELI
tara:strand:- start:596 stop:886 length:291 start_codon:yes stop_codon:yes gene_type:complete